MTILDRRALAARLPDLPRWVEVRGMLLREDCDVFGSEPEAPSFVTRNIAGDLVGVVGAASHAAIRAAVQDHAEHAEVIAPWELAAHVRAALPGWHATRARLHELQGPLARTTPDSPPGSQVHAALIEPGTSAWQTIPDHVRTELEPAAAYSPIAVTLVDDRAVAFSYAGYTTESLWDISIETLPDFQRRGYAALCVTYLIEHLRARGLRPVWGAVEENPASWRLAEKLGFTQVDSLVLLERHR
jgi:GNAT superfamily N-acetyltransferase